MTTYCNAVRKLEKKFEGLELHHVPRLKNKQQMNWQNLDPLGDQSRVMSASSTYTFPQ